jgi:hypothetical protein
MPSKEEAKEMVAENMETSGYKLDRRPPRRESQRRPAYQSSKKVGTGVAELKSRKNCMMPKVSRYLVQGNSLLLVSSFHFCGMPDLGDGPETWSGTA